MVPCLHDSGPLHVYFCGRGCPSPDQEMQQRRHPLFFRREESGRSATCRLHPLLFVSLVTHPSLPAVSSTRPWQVACPKVLPYHDSRLLGCRSTEWVLGGVIFPPFSSPERSYTHPRWNVTHDTSRWLEVWRLIGKRLRGWMLVILRLKAPARQYEHPPR